MGTLGGGLLGLRSCLGLKNLEWSSSVEGFRVCRV